MHDAQRSPLRRSRIRTALGATATDVRRLVPGQGFRLTLAAVAIGTPLALAAAYASASLLVEVQPNDPTILSGMSATLATVSLAASCIPARRATGSIRRSCCVLSKRSVGRTFAAETAPLAIAFQRVFFAFALVAERFPRDL